MGTKNDWANVGRDFKKLGTDFGKTFVKTIKKGTQKLDDWANDEKKPETDEVPVCEATVVEENKEN